MHGDLAHAKRIARQFEQCTKDRRNFITNEGCYIIAKTMGKRGPPRDRQDLSPS